MCGWSRPSACEVGNTGNTTQPHLHLQLMDGPEPRSAKGLPMAFSDYELEDGSAWRSVSRGMPPNGARIRAMRPGRDQDGAGGG
jgi:hypothetical protein